MRKGKREYERVGSSAKKFMRDCDIGEDSERV